MYNRCETHNFFQVRLVAEMLSYQHLTSHKRFEKEYNFSSKNEKLCGCAKCNSEKLHYKFGGYIKNADGLIWFSRWQRQTPDKSSATFSNGTRNDVCVGDDGGKVDCGGKP